MRTPVKFGFVVEYVSDIEAVTRHFIDNLGLSVEREHPTYVQFTDGAGATFAIASDESMTGSRDPELYWLIEDAEAAFADLSSKATISMPVRQMPFGKVFGVTDPAGQPHYFVEFAQDRPSNHVS